MPGTQLEGGLGGFGYNNYPARNVDLQELLEVT